MSAYTRKELNERSQRGSDAIKRKYAKPADPDQMTKPPSGPMPAKRPVRSYQGYCYICNTSHAHHALTHEQRQNIIENRARESV